jgi:hypothetical protein
VGREGHPIEGVVVVNWSNIAFTQQLGRSSPLTTQAVGVSICGNSPSEEGALVRQFCQIPGATDTKAVLRSSM